MSFFDDKKKSLRSNNDDEDMQDDLALYKFADDDSGYNSDTEYQNMNNHEANDFHVPSPPRITYSDTSRVENVSAVAVAAEKPSDEKNESNDDDLGGEDSNIHDRGNSEGMNEEGKESTVDNSNESESTGRGLWNTKTSSNPNHQPMDRSTSVRARATTFALGKGTNDPDPEKEEESPKAGVSDIAETDRSPPLRSEHSCTPSHRVSEKPSANATRSPSSITSPLSVVDQSEGHSGGNLRPSPQERASKERRDFRSLPDCDQLIGAGSRGKGADSFRDVRSRNLSDSPGYRMYPRQPLSKTAVTNKRTQSAALPSATFANSNTINRDYSAGNATRNTSLLGAQTGIHSGALSSVPPAPTPVVQSGRKSPGMSAQAARTNGTINAASTAFLGLVPHVAQKSSASTASLSSLATENARMKSTASTHGSNGNSMSFSEASSSPRPMKAPNNYAVDIDTNIEKLKTGLQRLECRAAEARDGPNSVTAKSSALVTYLGRLVDDDALLTALAPMQDAHNRLDAIMKEADRVFEEYACVLGDK